jgi:hypothetical protein
MHDYDYISLTTLGLVIATISAIISFVSSVIVLTIIARSERNPITSTYHRIIGLISIADLIMSFSISLTTLPMPKEVVYAFEGKSYGNALTCSIQAVCYLLGMYVSYLYSVGLTFYFSLLVRFKISEKMMRMRFEPILFLATLSFSSMSLSSSIKRQLLNPIPYIPWCSIGAYPIDCDNENGEVDCIRGDPMRNIPLPVFAYTGIAIFQLAVLIDLGLYVYRKDKGDNVEDHNQTFQNTRSYAKQAFLYFIAFILSFFFLPKTAGASDIVFLQICTLIFKPLQGFLNALIFINEKIEIMRHADEDLDFFEGLAKVIRNPRKEVSGMVMDDPLGILPSSRPTHMFVLGGRSGLAMSNEVQDDSSDFPGSEDASSASGLAMSDKVQDESADLSSSIDEMDVNSAVGFSRSSRSSFNDLSTNLSHDNIIRIANDSSSNKWLATT